ncbi:MAG: hypothetical protein IT442_04855 [Phycisphaeraceae bacterium]|nr:hypothetical protein [Phycisphaeraceae bacterium]
MNTTKHRHLVWILLLGLGAAALSPCALAQETQPSEPQTQPALSKYDMNGDGVVNIQDSNDFIAAMLAGYFTVQDINPFLAEVAQSQPQIQVIIGTGGAIYVDNEIPIQSGADPDRFYIVCRGLVAIEGVEYALTTDGRRCEVLRLCGQLGVPREQVTIVIIPNPPQP